MAVEPCRTAAGQRCEPPSRATGAITSLPPLGAGVNAGADGWLAGGGDGGWLAAGGADSALSQAAGSALGCDGATGALGCAG